MIRKWFPPWPPCHGNEDSWRVVMDGIFALAPEIAKYRVGPNGGKYRSRKTRLDNPDIHRRHVPGSRTEYAEPRPFQQARWCEVCGFLFEGADIDKPWGAPLDVGSLLPVPQNRARV